MLVLPMYGFYHGLYVFVTTIATIGIGILVSTFALVIVAGAIAFALILLNATIFRWAVGEPIPSARQLATGVSGTQC